MFTLFQALDQAVDSLGHRIHSSQSPGTSRSHPEVLLFLIALLLAVVAIFLPEGGSRESAILWGLSVLTGGLGLAFLVFK